MKLQIEDVTGDVVRRVFSHCEQLSSGCWRWTGMVRTVKGHLYPATSINGHQRTVRSVCWIARTGTEPPPGGVSPVCGDELCVAPHHLVVTPNRLAGFNAKA